MRRLSRSCCPNADCEAASIRRRRVVMTSRGSFTISLYLPRCHPINRFWEGHDFSRAAQSQKRRGAGGLAQLCLLYSLPRKRLPQLSVCWKAGHHRPRPVCSQITYEPPPAVLSLARAQQTSSLLRRRVSPLHNYQLLSPDAAAREAAASRLAA